MPFLSFLLTFLFTTLLSELLRPSPQSPQAQPPPDQGTFQFPTVSQGRPVPVIFGSVRVKGPNVLWWGNYRTIPVVKSSRVKTGLFSKKTITQVVAYRFFFSIVNAICHKGKGTDADFAVLQFLVEEKTAYIGGFMNGTVPVNSPNLFGGLDKDGGYIGGLAASNGGVLTYGQDTTGYRNLMTIGWDGEIGTNPFIKPWSFVVRRIPNALGTGAAGQGANPVEVAYEVLTDPLYGAGMPSSDIDVANFQAVGAILAAEGLGLNIQWDQRNRVADFLEQSVYRVADMVGFVSHLTGLYTLKLIRADYDVGAIFQADVSNILEVKNFSRGAWDQTVNDVKVVYTDPQRGYEVNTAQAQDLANFQIQGRVISQQVRFPQVVNATVANNLAWRELRAGSYPLAKATFILNREAYQLQPGDAFKVDWDPLGIVQMVFRVSKLKLGQLRDGKIEVEAVQDVFSLADSVFEDPQDSTWTPPLTSATPFTIEDTQEVPYQFYADDPERDPLNVPTEQRIMVLGARPSGGAIFSDLEARVQPSTAWEESRGQFDSFPPTGTLRDPYGLTGAVDESATLVVENTLDFEQVQGAVDLQDVLDNAVNLAFLGQELVAFRDVTDNLDGTYTLNGVVRGVWDTTIQEHAAGERLWVVYYGRMVTIPAYGPTDVVDLRHIPSTPIDRLDPNLATVLTHAINIRSQRPYPPGNVRMNGEFAPVYPPVAPGDYLSGDLLVEWNHRSGPDQTPGIVRQDDATDYGPETGPGTTYTLRVYNSSDVLLRTFTGITGTSQLYTWEQIIADNGGNGEDTLRIELEAQRGSLTSLQFQERKGQWGGYGFGYGTNYGGVA